MAVAEIDYQDLWQRAVVAAVTVSGDHGRAEQVLQAVEKEAACAAGAGPGRRPASSGWNELSHG